ncbi:DUF2867 domain-containing protein [Nonomuraea sp. NPDC003727]
MRWKLGALFEGDKPNADIGGQVPSLRDRLPSNLRAATPGSGAGFAPFTPVYELDDECALGLANKDRPHGHAPGLGGGHELRAAVLVNPGGLAGRLYMVAIAPFRHLIVLPHALGRRNARGGTVAGRVRQAAARPLWKAP